MYNLYYYQRKRSPRLARIVLLTLSILLISTLIAKAEGSKTLTPDTLSATIRARDTVNRYIGFLQHDDNDNSASFLKPSTKSGFSSQHRLYVHLRPGDTLFYGVRRIPTNNTGKQGNLILTLRYGIGTIAGIIAQQTTLNRDTSSTRHSTLKAGQAGVIVRGSEGISGPRFRSTYTLPSSGYKPLVYVNTTGKTYDFWIEFTQVSENTLGSGQKSWYDKWDFTVRNNGEKVGRLWSKQWSFNTGASNAVLSSTFNLYPLVPAIPDTTKFYVKRIRLAGLESLAFTLTSTIPVPELAPLFKTAEKVKSQIHLMQSIRSL